MQHITVVDLFPGHAFAPSTCPELVGLVLKLSKSGNENVHRSSALDKPLQVLYCVLWVAA